MWACLSLLFLQFWKSVIIVEQIQCTCIDASLIMKYWEGGFRMEVCHPVLWTLTQFQCKNVDFHTLYFSVKIAEFPFSYLSLIFSSIQIFLLYLKQFEFQHFGHQWWRDNLSLVKKRFGLFADLKKWWGLGWSSLSFTASSLSLSNLSDLKMKHSDFTIVSSILINQGCHWVWE